MQIIKSCETSLKNAYNIWCKNVFSIGDDRAQNPFALTECRIDPLGQSDVHQHDDQEIFLIKSGAGLMTIGSEEMPIAAGDAVFIPSNSFHTLKNISSTDILEFYSIAWLGPHDSDHQSHTLVIPAPPTPNGPLHLGHLSGPYLAADVFHRYQNMRKSPSLLLMGTDDNQCYITNKARALGLSCSQVLEKYKPQILTAFDDFLVKPHHIIEPKNHPGYVEFIQEFFLKLIEKNAIVQHMSPTVFCNSSKRYVFGADVRGQCPHCHESTLGHGCENCGHYNDGHDLKNLRSNLGELAVSVVDKERYYFPLSTYVNFLRETLTACDMHPRLRKFYDEYLHKGLPDVTASHFSEWGIEAPNMPGQTIYEWIEMAGAYVFYLQKAQKMFDTHPRNIALVEAFGFDNSFFYGLLVPALIHAYDPHLPRPRAFLSNYFYLLDNDKFSTSRNHAIWAHDFLSKVSADNVRFYLALTRAENGPSNFEMREFSRFIKHEILGTWQNFFLGLNQAIIKNHHIWQRASSLNGYQERFLQDVKLMSWEIHECYGSKQFSLNLAATKLMSFINFLFRFYERYRFTTKDFSINLSLLLSAISSWSLSLAPVMPTLAKKLSPSLITTESCIITPFDLSFFKKSELEMAQLDAGL